MKTLAFALAVAFCASSYAQSPAPLQIKALAPERDGNFDDFLGNLGVVNQNLNLVLNVLDSPDKYSSTDQAVARQQLFTQSKLADEYIRRADVQLARTDLPQDHEKTWVSFPRISLIMEGSESTLDREIATARAQILSAQFTLLNVKVAKPSAEPDKHLAEYEKWLADGRAALAKTAVADH
jgi:hypothetical protein